MSYSAGLDESDLIQIQLRVELAKATHPMSDLLGSWFEGAFDQLGGELRERLLARELEPARVAVPSGHRVAGAPGDVWADMYIALLDGGDVVIEGAWSRELWQTFLEKLRAGWRSASFSMFTLKDDARGGVTPGLREFRLVGGELSSCKGWAIVKLEAPRQSVLDRPGGESALLRFLRMIADNCNPAYGEVAPSTGMLLTPYEYENQLFKLDVELPTSRTALRGYSWLTIISDDLSGQLGGPAQLIDSGAFYKVEPLRRGGCWLQATEHYANYTPAAAEKVRLALQSVLVPSRL